MINDLSQPMEKSVQDAIARAEKRFYGHDKLMCKYDMQVPAACDREYSRIVNDLMRIIKEELEKELPNIRTEYKRLLAQRRKEEAAGKRHDGIMDDLYMAVSQVFQRILNKVISRTQGSGLRRRLESLAHLTRKLTVKEWKKAIHATLGLDIREDFYLGDFFKKQLDIWRDQNVDLIKTIPHDSLGKMRDIVYDGFMSGRTTKDIVKDIQSVYNNSKARATLIARDQMAKLNSDITQAQQTGIGLEEYIWSTCNDERVRDCHKAFEGQTFRWDSPPEIWHPKIKNGVMVGIVYEGRYCHPGKDYQCRCVARPVFTKGSLKNIPIQTTDVKAA